MNLVTHYTCLRTYLIAVAYNMTGQRMEAEDIVQDAFEDVLKKDAAEIRNAKSYLTRIVIHKAADRLRVLQKHREDYPGEWLPEPFISAGDEEAEAILPYAFMRLMETLSPVERAVLILREAFHYRYEDIAELCETTLENCRQLLHRAKAKIARPATVPARHTAEADKLLDAFLDACLRNDASSLSSVLKDDVKLYSDGGGKALAARNTLRGFSSVSKFLLGVARKTYQKWEAARPIVVNGERALLLPAPDGVYMILMASVDTGKVLEIFIMRNPDKIFLPNHVTKTSVFQT